MHASNVATLHVCDAKRNRGSRMTPAPHVRSAVETCCWPASFLGLGLGQAGPPCTCVGGVLLACTSLVLQSSLVGWAGSPSLDAHGGVGVGMCVLAAVSAAPTTTTHTHTHTHTSNLLANEPFGTLAPQWTAPIPFYSGRVPFSPRSGYRCSTHTLLQWKGAL